MGPFPPDAPRALVRATNPAGTAGFEVVEFALTLRRQCRGQGRTIGFGDCAGKVIPARADPYAR